VAGVSGLALWTGIASASALGAVLRFWLDGLVSRRLAGRLPAGTLVVNLSGAAALGLLAGGGLGHGAYAVLGVGLVGSYTTFSTWMLESLWLAEDGRTGAAAANVGLQVALGLAAAAGGWAIGAAL
jgi:CrcB protein